MSMLITRQELASIGRAAIAGTPGIRLSPALVDVPGSDLNVVVGMFSVLAENVAARGAKGQRGAFAELARGSQLDQLISDRTGSRILRFGANPATVDLVLGRPTPGSSTPGTFAASSVVTTASGVQFATETDAVFGGFTTTAYVAAKALVAGVDGNVGAGEIVGFGTSPFDSHLTVTNPAPAAGGLDTEDDIPFLGRYLAFFPTLSRGTLGAIEFGAMQVPGIAVATASESLNPSNSMPAAFVQLVIGDLNGNATSDMVTAVASSLLGYRSLGIPVSVLIGQVAYQAVQWAPAFTSGTSEALAIQRLTAVTVAVAQYLPPGPGRGTLYRAKLITAAQQIPGLIISDSSLRLPAGDVVPATTNTMLRILPTQVTYA